MPKRKRKRKLTTIATIPWQGSTPPARRSSRKKVSGPADQTNVVPFVLPAAKAPAGTDFTIEDQDALVLFTAVSEEAIETLPSLGVDTWQDLPRHRFIMGPQGGVELGDRLFEAGWVVEWLSEVP